MPARPASSGSSASDSASAVSPAARSVDQTAPGLDLISAVLLAGAAAVLIELPGAWLSAAGPRRVQAAQLICSAVAVGVCGVALLQARRRAEADPQRVSVLGAATVVRSGSVLVLLCAWNPAIGGGTGPHDLWWAGLAGLILTATIAVEDLVLRLVRLPVPFVHALPGVRPLPGVSGLVPAITYASVLALVLGVVLRWLGAPGWAWALVALLSTGPMAWVIRHTRARRRAGGRLSAVLPEALAEYAPEFVLYTARPDDASYQVLMWLPFLRRTGRRFVIVTRAALPAERLAALTDVPVLQRRTATELEAALVPSVRAAFYVNASSGNGALTRFGHLEHVYLGHGDSDKPPSYNPTHAMFDTIFAAGPAAVRRYADHGVQIAADKFRLVGRPQVESVLPAQRPLAGVSDPVVLYAPTWRGHVSETALSSLAAGEAIVDALVERGATVIFRPHPFSYDFAEDAATAARIQDRLAAEARRTGRAHRWGAAAETDLSVVEAMNAADALVSDVSSVVSDFLFSSKPYVMIATTDALTDFVRDYPIAHGAYLVDPGLVGLSAALDRLLGDDPYAERRRQLRSDYLATPDGDRDQDGPAGTGGGYAQLFVDAVTDVLDAPAGPDQPTVDTDDGVVRVSRDTVRRHTRVLARTVLGLTGGVLALTGALSGDLSRPGPGVPTGSPFGPAAAVLTVALLVGALLRTLVAERGAARRARTPGAAGASTSTPDRPTDRLTVLDAGRVALALAVVATAAPRLSGSGSGLLIGAFTLVLILPAVVVESTAVRLLSADGVVAAGLPELRVREVSALSQLRAPLVGSAVLALTGLVALLVPGSVGLILLPLIAVPGAVVALRLARAALDRAADAAGAEDRLPAVLGERRIRFCVYFGAGIGAGYQLGMWLPYFDRIGAPYLIVCRDRSAFAEIRALVGDRPAPVLLRETLGSLEAVLVPGLTTAFYVNNAVRNTHLIERRELTHVWLNHGDSEKPACFNPVHAIYDLIFVAGQAGIDRYARHGVEIPSSKFRIVGRPQVEGIGSPDAAAGPVGEPVGEPVPERTVLYAPTWRGPYADSQLCSLPAGVAIVEGLLRRGVRVIFRAHPFNYRFPDATAMIAAVTEVLARDRRRTGRDHLWGPDAEVRRSVIDCFNASDAMISDVSAMVSDYLQSTKPYAIVAMGRRADQLSAEVPAAAAGYVLDEQLAELDPVLDRLLGADPLRQPRRDLRDYYLGSFPAESYADGFLDAARAVIGRHSP